MRPWMIGLASSVVAIAVVAALAAPAVLAAPPGLALPPLLPPVPMLVLAALAAYAAAAVVLSTAALVGSIAATRRRLTRLRFYRTATEPDWLAVFGETGLRRLARPLAPPTQGRPSLVLAEAFSAAAARRELARLHYIWLARTQFFTALIALAGIALAGLALRQPLALLPFAIPTGPVAATLAAALLVAALCRLALDIAADPLIAVLARLPVERTDTVLLRRAVELLEYSRATIAAPAAAAPSGGRELVEEIVAALEGERQALLAALRDVAARTGALAPALEAAVARFDDAIRAAAAPPPAVEGFAELRQAVEALTALLERFAAVTETAAEEGPATAESPLRLAPVNPRLARELRQLLREIETAP